MLSEGYVVANAITLLTDVCPGVDTTSMHLNNIFELTKEFA